MIVSQVRAWRKTQRSPSADGNWLDPDDLRRHKRLSDAGLTSRLSEEALQKISQRLAAAM